MYHRKNNTYGSHAISIVLSTLLACAMPAFAEVDNVKENIHIRADYMQFDLNTGSSIYEGNVSIKQGGIELSGDRVVIERDNEEIHQIEIDGKPARYIQDVETENKVYAESQHMKYSAEQNQLFMTRDARLEQADRIVESQKIVYDTKNKVIIAGKESNDKQNGDRVNITLTPKKETTDTSPVPGANP